MSYWIWNEGADFSIRSEKGGLYILDTLGNIKFTIDPSKDDYINNATCGWNNKDGYYDWI